MTRRRRGPGRALAVLALVAGAGMLAHPARAGRGGAKPAVYPLGPVPTGPARRVVTLAPSLTDTVLALGGAARLVGVTRYDAAKAVAGLPRVGGYLDPNLEAILELRPDLVICQPSPGNQGVVERLAALKVPILVVRAHTLKQVEAMIRAVGARLGRAHRAAKVVARLEARLARVRRAARGLPRPRTLLVYGHHPLVVAGPGTYGDELLRLAGGRNVVAGAVTPYPTWPLEQVVAADPDVIIDLVVGEGSARPPDYAALTSLSAVRHHRVVHLADPALQHPGPALGDGVAALFRALHPKHAGRLDAAARRNAAPASPTDGGSSAAAGAPSTPDGRPATPNRGPSTPAGGRSP